MQLMSEFGVGLNPHKRNEGEKRILPSYKVKIVDIVLQEDIVIWASFNFFMV